jgi:hypothetical protein
VVGRGGRGPIARASSRPGAPDAPRARIPIARRQAARSRVLHGRLGPSAGAERPLGAALAKAGLLRSVGERRNGNFVEQLYESTAGTYILSPRITWGESERVRTLAEQLSLRHLVEFGERLQRDAITLLDRATFEGDEIPSAAVEATVHFADPAARSAFLDEYLRLTAELVEKHAAKDGDAYIVGLAVHPRCRETT